jgi:hypothetical protein
MSTTNRCLEVCNKAQSSKTFEPSAGHQAGRTSGTCFRELASMMMTEPCVSPAAMREPSGLRPTDQDNAQQMRLGGLSLGTPASFKKANLNQATPTTQKLYLMSMHGTGEREIRPTWRGEHVSTSVTPAAELFRAHLVR